MICTFVELKLDSLEPKDVAKAMLKFWLFQAEQARIKRDACKGRMEAGRRANKQALEEWQKGYLDTDWGPPKPFSDEELEQLEGRLPTYEKELQEANAMAGYVINHITEKAHP